MGFYTNKNLAVWVTPCYVTNSLTFGTGFPLVAKDILKEIVIAADTELITAIPESRQRKKPIHRLIVKPRGCAYRSANAVLNLLPVRVPVVVSVSVTPHRSRCTNSREPAFQTRQREHRDPQGRQQPSSHRQASPCQEAKHS